MRLVLAEGGIGSYGGGGKGGKQDLDLRGGCKHTLHSVNNSWKCETFPFY